MVVEDDPVSSEMIEIALALMPGISIRACSSAEAARRALTEETVDAVITDVNLPGENGLALVELLRNTPKWSALPVIVTTSSREPEVRRRAEAMGVRAFLQKPWSPGSLRDTVHSLFNDT